MADTSGFMRINQKPINRAQALALCQWIDSNPLKIDPRRKLFHSLNEATEIIRFVSKAIALGSQSLRPAAGVRQRKAAERTAALHDAGASKRALELAKLLDCACLFWRFWFGEIRWRSRIGSNRE